MSNGTARLARVKAEKEAAREAAPRDTAKRSGTQDKPRQNRPSRNRRKFDRDAVPEGYDADVWDVAMYFAQLAESRGFQLAAGLPVLYSKLEHRIGQANLRDVKRWRDGHPLKWVPVAKCMVLDFWDDEVWLPNSAYAIDQFCGVEMFASLRDRILRQLEASYAREHMTRQEPGQFIDVPEDTAEEEVPVFQKRDNPRTWEERRAAVKRIRELRGNTE